MTPALRLALSLMVSLLLWLPTIPAALDMHDPPETIALRYLLALIVSRVGVGVVFRVIRMYAKQVTSDSETAGDRTEPPAEDDLSFGRRREDLADQDITEEQQLDDALEEAHEAAVLTS